MSQEPDSPRAGSLVPSKGIEWSFVWLAVGILGMVLSALQRTPNPHRRGFNARLRRSHVRQNVGGSQVCPRSGERGYKVTHAT